MCFTVYLAYELCPCQIRTANVLICPCQAEDQTRLKAEPCPFPRKSVTGPHCHYQGKKIVQTGEPYCQYHYKCNKDAERERKQYFIDRGRKLWPRPEGTPVLGRRIGGMPIRAATAADLERFPMPLEHYFLDDSSDDEPYGEDEKMWNFTSVFDEQEWYGCRSHYQKAGQEGKSYWHVGPRPRPGSRTLLSVAWKTWVILRLLNVMVGWQVAAVAPRQPNSSFVWYLSWPYEWAILPYLSTPPAKPRCKSDAPKQASVIDAMETNQTRVPPCKKPKQFRKRSKRPMVWFKKHLNKKSEDEMTELFFKFVDEHKWIKDWVVKSLGAVSRFANRESQRICIPASHFRLLQAPCALSASVQWDTAQSASDQPAFAKPASVPPALVQSATAKPASAFVELAFAEPTSDDDTFDETD